MVTGKNIEDSMIEDLRHGLLFLEKLDRNEISHSDLMKEDIEQILIFTFSESVSEYWPNLALNLLDKHSFYMTDKVGEAMRKLLDAKWVGQKMQHKMQKMIRLKNNTTK